MLSCDFPAEELPPSPHVGTIPPPAAHLPSPHYSTTSHTPRQAGLDPHCGLPLPPAGGPVKFLVNHGERKHGSIRETGVPVKAEPGERLPQAPRRRVGGGLNPAEKFPANSNRQQQEITRIQSDRRNPASPQLANLTTGFQHSGHSRALLQRFFLSQRSRCVKLQLCCASASISIIFTLCEYSIPAKAVTECGKFAMVLSAPTDPVTEPVPGHALSGSLGCAEGTGLGCQVTHLLARSQTTTEAQSSQPHRGIVGQGGERSRPRLELLPLRGREKSG
ncbi:hypothetical protein AAFF_G00290610 [Aldrovandia affinis]|uniref:Uncharacterized protein n=1 Tax=Aldrovandia affinis TaxID=143900 RepID=A0AAD7W0W4_9TELE|nr:hypothetical protein AAFF_G00290610 [Aldrovandia affinis]